MQAHDAQVAAAVGFTVLNAGCCRRRSCAWARLGLSSRATRSYDHTGGGRRDATRPAPLAGLTLLDVGCGGGLLSEALARLGAAVTGVDAGADSIAVARTHAAADPELLVSYRAATAEQLVAEGAQAWAYMCDSAGQELGIEVRVKCWRAVAQPPGTDVRAEASAVRQIIDNICYVRVMYQWPACGRALACEW